MYHTFVLVKAENQQHIKTTHGEVCPTDHKIMQLHIHTYS